MKEYEVFLLKEEHIILLNDASVTWSYFENGAPTIDPKRPYGASGHSMLPRMAEKLGWELEDEEKEELTTDEFHRLCQVHDETEHALSIVLSTKSFAPGLYRREKYERKWERVTEEMDNAHVTDLNEEIKLRIIEEETNPKRTLLEKLKRVGLDADRMNAFRPEELRDILERRRQQIEEEEKQRLDDLIRLYRM